MEFRLLGTGRSLPLGSLVYRRVLIQRRIGDGLASAPSAEPSTSSSARRRSVVVFRFSAESGLTALYNERGTVHRILAD